MTTIAVEPCRLCQAIDDIGGVGVIELTPGELPEGEGFRRHCPNLTIIGSPESVIHAPLTLSGNVAVRGVYFEGQWASLAFPSSKSEPTDRVKVLDCRFDRSDSPITSESQDGTGYVLVDIESVTMHECFRKPNTKGIYFGSPVGACLIRLASMIDCGGGNQCHGIYGWGSARVIESFGQDLNVENFADFRGERGYLVRCVTRRVPALVSSHANTTIDRCIDLDGVEAYSGRSIGIKLRSSQYGPKRPNHSIYRTAILDALGRSHGIVIEDEFGTPQGVVKVADCYIDNATVGEGTAIKANAATPIELSANRVRHDGVGRGLHIAKSGLIQCQGDRWYVFNHELGINGYANTADLNAFVGGGNVDQDCGVSRVRPEDWESETGKTLEQDWPEYQRWFEAKVWSEE